MPLISIILVSWNSVAHLLSCLCCLARQTLRNFEVVIINNSSTDIGLSDLNRKFPELDLYTTTLDQIKVLRLQTTLAPASLVDIGWGSPKCRRIP